MRYLCIDRCRNIDQQWADVCGRVARLRNALFFHGVVVAILRVTNVLRRSSATFVLNQSGSEPADA
jgi:hypothetical protein